MDSSRRRLLYRLWTDIQDCIGSASQWPRKIRALFWTKNPSHWDRILLCAFVHVNPLNPVIFFEWVAAFCMFDNRENVNHMRRLLNYFDEGRYARSLYAWNNSMYRYEYLDGTPAYY
ncbi:hypothetical protein ElyMa_005791700 [Elysia marginata]|uniref:Uncharacterized protein n=1 Tax=Elysia marginata TaxID=1093978 RepID=A0AAV4FST1_9GAST|nr:hypothetical protein ElyMa_005791700 [Elysia marginata]